MVLPSEPEFEQARNELAISIAPFLAKHPEYERAFEIVQVSKESPCPVLDVMTESNWLADTDPRAYHSVPRCLGRR
jgi:hypothetical protein